jgi:hypothetical protein
VSDPGHRNRLERRSKPPPRNSIKSQDVYYRAYRLTCHKRDRFLGNPDFAALDAAEQFRRLAGLIAVELGADPKTREPVRRAVEDAMTGHLPAW